MSEIEEAFAFQLRAVGLPEPERQVVLFPADRKFVYDFVYREARICIEVQGGIWRRGDSGHSSGRGILRDYEKSNLAQSHGWRCFHFAPEHIESGEAVQMVERALKGEEVHV